jgi:hypothetical protein
MQCLVRARTADTALLNTTDHTSAAARRAILELLGVNPDDATHGDGGGEGEFSQEFRSAQHERACPRSRRAVVGGAGGAGSMLDGSYVVCLPLPSPCVAYSFGVGGDFSFDDAMASGATNGLASGLASAATPFGHGCRVFAFDHTMRDARSGLQSAAEPRCRPSGVTFSRVGLGVGGQERVRLFSLSAVARRLHHSRVDVLKIDVEANEWLPLAEALGVAAVTEGVDAFGFARPPHDRRGQQLLARVSVLLLELHFFGGDDARFGSLPTKLAVLGGLRRLGFRPYFVRENLRCQHQRRVPCFEVAFVNAAGAAAAATAAAAAAESPGRALVHQCSNGTPDPFSVRRGGVRV